MTALHDPDNTTMPLIDRFRAELLMYNPELLAQYQEDLAQAFIAGAKYILEREK